LDPTYVTGFYTKDAQEKGAGPSGATGDEDPNHVQNDDVGTEEIDTFHAQ